jgi:hypothetical protein
MAHEICAAKRLGRAFKTSGNEAMISRCRPNCLVLGSRSLLTLPVNYRFVQGDLPQLPRTIDNNCNDLRMLCRLLKWKKSSGKTKIQ